MATANLVVTAKYGHGKVATAQPINNVLTVKFDVYQGMLYVDNGVRVAEYDISAISTVTCTISGQVYTFTIS